MQRLTLLVHGTLDTVADSSLYAGAMRRDALYTAWLVFSQYTRDEARRHGITYQHQSWIYHPTEENIQKFDRWLEEEI